MKKRVIIVAVAVVAIIALVTVLFPEKTVSADLEMSFATGDTHGLLDGTGNFLLISRGDLLKGDAEKGIREYSIEVSLKSEARCTIFGLYALYGVSKNSRFTSRAMLEVGEERRYLTEKLPSGLKALMRGIVKDVPCATLRGGDKPKQEDVAVGFLKGDIAENPLRDRFLRESTSLFQTRELELSRAVVLFFSR